MPRQVRVQYEDAIYHVMARGNRLDWISRCLAHRNCPLSFGWQGTLGHRFHRVERFFGGDKQGVEILTSKTNIRRVFGCGNEAEFVAVRRITEDNHVFCREPDRAFGEFHAGAELDDFGVGRDDRSHPFVLGWCGMCETKIYYEDILILLYLQMSGFM